MSDQYPTNPRQDEMDLGQVFSLIGKGLTNLFKSFLRLFVYVRSNILLLAILAIVGLAIGYGMTKIISEKLKTEVIVSPNLESKHYLYDAVAEINGKIRSKDSEFFGSLGIDPDVIEAFEIVVEDLVEISDNEKEADMALLEVLQKFQGTLATNDLIGELLLDKNTLDQRITFYYKNADAGPEATQKLIDHINSNAYFGELVRVYNENDAIRISQNEAIIAQLDAIIKSYTEGMNDSRPEGQLVLAEEDEMNVADLFALKNTLLTQTELRKIELQKRKSPLSIVNFGSSQPANTPLFGKSLFLAPFILIALFVLKDIIRYFNRKSNELLN